MRYLNGLQNKNGEIPAGEAATSEVATVRDATNSGGASARQTAQFVGDSLVACSAVHIAFQILGQMCVCGGKDQFS